MVGFFAKTRVIMEFLFPRLTDVLSTEVPTQLDHEISWVCNTESIFVKMDSAVAACTPIRFIIINGSSHIIAPVVTHIWVLINPEFSSNKEIVIGFIFLSPVSLLPSMAIENGPDFMLCISINLKCGANDPLIIQVDFVRAQAYPLAISLSEKTYLNRAPK